MHRNNYGAEVIILAGGEGKRMGKEYENEQKCLLPIDGEPIIKHTLGALATALCKANVLICVSHEAQQVKDFVRKNTPKGLSIEYLEDDGHSSSTRLFRDTRGLTADTFIGTAGDIVVEPEVYSDIFDVALGRRAIMSVALATDTSQVDTHALGRIAEGRLMQLEWPPMRSANEGQFRDMTIWGMSQDFYDFADDNLDKRAFPQLVIKALEEGREIPAVLYDGKWVHVGYPDDLNKSMLERSSLDVG